MSNKTKLGFSLIELSIVILIIGILVIGITKGSRIITAAKLTSAQGLTKSSPVASTQGLIFWLETSRDLSLENNSSSFGVSDGDTIKNWHNINPQSNDSIVFSQATQANQPAYIKSGINGLPSLVFDGTNSSRDLAVSDSNSISPPSEITLFAVIKQIDNTGLQGVISKDNGGGISNPPYVIAVSSGIPIFSAAQSSNNSTSNSTSSALSLNTPYIINGYVLNKQAYLVVNSTAASAGISKTLLFHSTGALRIGQQKNGANRFFNGYISEIIMFNRVLKNWETTGINQYLSSKYNIKL